ncbi:cytochrome c [Vogesella sp. LIG4]|uniref:c-type cytochrome n=1 Tax=Vogesella sp. LIG4 TaxID=1192162 RepID=UPI00082012A7|nr:cytochrome c [Vogesella sp. LIG4]SCK19339.1 cytochrome c55X [Vogesella sp. LIG4]
MKPPPASPLRLSLKCLLLLVCSAVLFYESAHAETPGAPAPARTAELQHLLRQDCGACHGMTLQGGLGSPLTAAALAGKPADSLVATLLDGRPGTAMPPWRPFISEDEARWLIRQLQQGSAP